MEHMEHGKQTSRRTVVMGAAWSIPVVAAATLIPSASASGGPVITPGTDATLAGACDQLGIVTFTLRDERDQPIAGEVVTVTLPAGFAWADESTGSKTFTTDSTGTISITGIKVSSLPGSYLVTAQASTSGAEASFTVTVEGIWVGNKVVGYIGAGMWPVYATTPANTQNPTESPDSYAYCIEHDVNRRTRATAGLGGLESYLGSNLFKTDAQVPGQVLWILEHSYPALSLDAFKAASGITNITVNNLIEVTQYAIWRFTDLGYDSDWQWDVEADSKPAYLYLVNGAKDAAANGTLPTNFTDRLVTTAVSDCGDPETDGHRQTQILAYPM